MRRQHSEEILPPTDKMELNYIPRAHSLPTDDPEDDTDYNDFLDLLNDDEDEEQNPSLSDETTLTEGKFFRC